MPEPVPESESARSSRQRSGSAEERLPLTTILVYSAPAVGIGFMFLLTSMYLMKFSTDVLAIPPAAMGTIFLVSRLWDAFSDPLAGFLSDRTRTRLGRRRPWLLAGALPVGAVFVLMWSPPSLDPDALVLWMGGSVVLFYTGLTIFLMPHDSLGAELTTGYHERNRVFGVKRIAFGAGTLLVFFAVARLTSSPDPRSDAFSIALLAGGLTTALMLYTGWRVRERPEHQGRGASRPLGAFADVLRNRHARLLLGVFFTQQLAVSALTLTAAYHTQYVLGRAEALPYVLGAFFLASICSVPVWVALGRRFEKKPLLVASMCSVACAMGGVFFVGEGELALLLGLALLGGASGGCADVIFPSIQADVIDYDEYRTGERKEGIYFATWNFVAKTAVGLVAMLTGFALSASGFEPNQPQPESARLAIRLLMSVFPFLCYGLGMLVFLRFRLDRRRHAEIRAVLDERC